MAKRPKKTAAQKAAVKRIRSGLAILKRKKVIPKTIEVRKATSTAATRRLLRVHKDVIEKKATTFKISDKAVKSLKEKGYKIIGGKGERRAIVPQSQYIRKGEIYERPTPLRKGYRVREVYLSPERIDEIINKAFAQAKPNDLLGFEVGAPGGKGGQSVSIFASPTSMMRQLMAYYERGFKISHLRIYQTTVAKQSRFRDERISRELDRRRERYRMKREQITGLRQSRGH